MNKEKDIELPSVGKIMIKISLLTIIVDIIRGGFTRKNIIFAILCTVVIGSIYLGTRCYKNKKYK